MRKTVRTARARLDAGHEPAIDRGGDKHDLYTRDGRVIAIPRRRTLSVGVARSIARAAGWE